jgi:methylmalonyl-CoA mutase N-terminal domain/subunit
MPKKILGVLSRSVAVAALWIAGTKIIAYESGVANTIDPLAGSFYVETLTDELEAEATRYIDKIA